MGNMNQLFEKPGIYQLWYDALQTPVSEVLELLSEYETIRELQDIPVEKLRQIKGIGLMKAKQIKAILELAGHITALPSKNRIIIRRPQDVADILMPRLRYEDREQFVVLHLNTKSQLLRLETVAVGILGSAPIHPREVFKNAIINSSAGIILSHNHPSGDPTPSQDDLVLTNRLKESGELLGIKVMDHVIIGDGRYISIKEMGKL